MWTSERSPAPPRWTSKRELSELTPDGSQAVPLLLVSPSPLLPADTEGPQPPPDERARAQLRNEPRDIAGLREQPLSKAPMCPYAHKLPTPLQHPIARNWPNGCESASGYNAGNLVACSQMHAPPPPPLDASPGMALKLPDKSSQSDVKAIPTCRPAHLDQSRPSLTKN